MLCWGLLTQHHAAVPQSRTPAVSLFVGLDRESNLQRLKNVLHAYALHDPVTGYCQGVQPASWHA